MKDTYRSFIVPPGKYWLVDPYHVFQKKPVEWLDYFKACASADINLHGQYESFDARPPVLSFAATCGAAEYHDQHGNSYKSATGLLGLVPLDYTVDCDIEDAGQQVEFDAEALCFTKDGILTFGNYIIDTIKECEPFEAYEI